jgi:hypothetical protein
MPSDPLFRPLIEIARDLRERRASARELVEAAIARHERFGERLHAYSFWAPGRYGKLYFCYEAGPTGYGLYRQVRALGHDCIVVAPSLVPKGMTRQQILDVTKRTLMHRGSSRETDAGVSSVDVKPVGPNAPGGALESAPFERRAFALRSISPQWAPKVSPVRVAVKIAHSSASVPMPSCCAQLRDEFVDLFTGQRFLVLDRIGLLPKQ